MGRLTPLLTLDTSSPTGSVAITRGESVLFERSFAAGRSHSSQLFAVLEEALAVVSAAEIGQIAVGLGPGSYAGVRIGLSAAVGMAVASGAKLVGLPSIAGLAGGEYAVIGDARRESHFLAQVKDEAVIREPELIPSAELAGRLAGLPAGLPVYATELPLPQLELYGAVIRTPSALLLARCVANGRGVVESEPLEPIYLREPHITKPSPHRGGAGLARG